MCGEMTLVPKMCGKLAKRAVCPQIKAEALGPFVSLAGMGLLGNHALLLAIYGLLALCSGSSDDEVIAPILQGNL